MNGKLIFVDVDDTLFSNTTSSVPDSAVKAIKQGQKNGHKFFINTGRPFSYFEDEILEIGFDGLLCSNGADLRIGGESVFHKTLPDNVSRELEYLAIKYGISGCLQGSECLYFKDHDRNFHPHYTYMIDSYDRNPQMPHQFTWDNPKPYEKGSFFSNNSDPSSDMAAFVHAVNDMEFGFDCVRIRDDHYEMLPKGYHKGTAIEFTAKYFGKTVEDCYAFGDSNNDTEMLITAAHGIAMGNACDELKEVADYITTSVDDDGLYHGLKHFQLI